MKIISLILTLFFSMSAMSQEKATKPQLRLNLESAETGYMTTEEFENSNITLAALESFLYNHNSSPALIVRKIKKLSQNVEMKSIIEEMLKNDSSLVDVRLNIILSDEIRSVQIPTSDNSIMEADYLKVSLKIDLLRKDDETLYCTDLYTERLYSVDLPQKTYLSDENADNVAGKLISELQKSLREFLDGERDCILLDTFGKSNQEIKIKTNRI
ncbi:MAG: hypothetical protein JNM93_03255 [Bacteriovoracaceae bacterium]|nr:hypothetical protein [Bacteriovoracaceae bacterium]